MHHYPQSKMSQTWQWMVWPSAYIKENPKRTQPGTQASVTIPTTETDTDPEYEIYKLQFRQILLTEMERQTIWKMTKVILQTTCDKDGQHIAHISGNDEDQGKKETNHWCTAAAFTRTTNTHIMQLQKTPQTQQTTLQTHITAHTTANIEALQLQQNKITNELKTMIMNMGTEQQARILQDKHLQETISIIKQQITSLKKRPLPTTTTTTPDQNAIPHNLELKLETLNDALQTIAHNTTSQQKHLLDIQHTINTLKQNTNHRQNFEPWLQRMIDSDFTQSNWIHTYNTTNTKMRKINEITTKYNQYMDAHDRDHPEHRSPLDTLADIFDIFADAFNIGKTIKNLTTDEYSSMIGDIAAATTAVKNVTGSIHDISETVNTVHNIVDNIRRQWTTEKNTFKDTVDQMKSFETDGRTEILQLRQEITKLRQNVPIPKVCLRKNDILP